MSDEHFSQKEILQEVIKKLDATHDILIAQGAKLENVLAQTTKTNGRVTKLEDEMEVVQQKTENLGVKVGAAVFLGAAVVSGIVSNFFK